MYDESTHTAPKAIGHPSYINNRLKVKCPFCIFVSYAQAITHKNCTKSTSVMRAATIKTTNGAVYPNYRCCAHQLLSEKWRIHCTSCQRFSIHYTPIWINIYLKSTSVINVVTMKNTDNFQCTYKGSHHVQPSNRHISMSANLWQRWMEHKGGHWLVQEECILLTAVCQKAHLWLKWHQIVKN